MILSHSSIACASTSDRITKLSQTTAYRFEELDLSIRQVAQNFPHLGFFCVLENRLLPQRFLAEGIGCLVSGRNRIL